MKTARIQSSRGFTLIEIMIVMGIMAMIMAIGVPAIFSTLKKDALRKAVSDVVEVCSEARAHAILSGYPTEVLFYPQDATCRIGMVGSQSASDDIATVNASGGAAGFAPPAVSAPAISRRWSEELVLEMLSVNFEEYKDEELARVRFFPNGTCDEFTMVLQWPPKRAFRKISLDIISASTDVEVLH